MNATNSQPASDPLAAAKAAKLRYVSDEQPGFTRKRRGRGFAYYDAHGALLRDPEHLSAAQVPDRLQRRLRPRPAFQQRPEGRSVGRERRQHRLRQRE